MNEGTMSPADLMAMIGNSNNGANAWMNNPFIWFVFLALFGNGGFNFGGGGRSATAEAELTRAEMMDGLNNQSVQSDLRGIGSAIASGFADANITANSNANMINQSLCGLGSNVQMGFCGVNNNIGSLKYEMAQNCCEIKNAVHSEGETTRALITQNTIQDLRDKLAEKDNTLQSAQLALANANQTQSILNSLGKFVPYAGGVPCSSTFNAPCCPSAAGW